MKILFITVLVLICGNLNGIAQPNGGFENWIPEASYENPDGWQTGNFLSLNNPPNPLSAFKAIGLDTHSGFYALKLKTVYVNNNPWPGVIGDSSGGAFTGKINYSPFSYKYGSPYTGRPEKLEFWCKYAPVGNDTAGAAVMLLKWNGTGRDTIAFGGINISLTTVYTLFELNLTYYSTDLPDSAFISFVPSKDNNIARVNSTLFIDDVTFTGWVGMDEQNSASEKVKVFPNPTKEDLNIDTENVEATEVRVIGSSGKLAGIYKIQNNKATINTRLFTAGSYFYDILDNKGNVFTKGKFNVIR